MILPPDLAAYNQLAVTRVVGDSLLAGNRWKGFVRRAADVSLSPTERSVLEQWAARQGSSERLAIRAQIVLEAAGGRPNGEIARLLGIHPETVSRWRNRFVINRVDGLRRDAPRSGSRASPSSDVANRILRATLEETPPSGSRWSTRSLARFLQVSHMRVYRVWRSHGISVPQATGQGPSSLEPPALDVAGVYIDRTAVAIVFSVSRAELPPAPAPELPAVPTAVSGGYLFTEPGVVPTALVEVLASAEELLPRVRGSRRSPHELLVFLRTVEEASGPDAQLHIILDRPLQLLPERVSSWLAVHPRFRAYSTNAATSWIESVADWLQTWRGVPLARSSFSRVAEFTEAIARTVGSTRAEPRRFSWTAPMRARPSPPGAPSAPGAPGTPLGPTRPRTRKRPEPPAPASGP